MYLPKVKKVHANDLGVDFWEYADDLPVNGSWRVDATKFSEEQAQEHFAHKVDWHEVKGGEYVITSWAPDMWIVHFTTWSTSFFKSEAELRAFLKDIGADEHLTAEDLTDQLKSMIRCNPSLPIIWNTVEMSAGELQITSVKYVWCLDDGTYGQTPELVYAQLNEWARLFKYSDATKQAIKESLHRAIVVWFGAKDD